MDNTGHSNGKFEIITLTDDDDEHESDEQPSESVEFVRIVGPRTRWRTRPVRHCPSQTVYAGRFGQPCAVLVMGGV